jgi:6-phosphofructo-2-kinase/fructose-2,6-biphosphatase 2
MTNALSNVATAPVTPATPLTNDEEEEYSPRLYAKSQEDLLRAQSYNPAPTTVPPPIAALAGNIGERHVLVFIGLPLRGKRTIALRLKRYLRFFHGARCRAFDVASANQSQSSSSASSGRSISSQLREFLTDGGATTAETEDADGSVRRRHTVDRLREEYGIDTFSDANAKHVDSGRVAVVYSSDASKTFYETWSGTSKERRRAILKDLAAIEAEERDFGGGSRKVKTIFIETTLTREELIEEVLAQRVARDVRNGKVSEEEIEEAKEAWRRRIDEYRKLYVTLQEDGSEDDLSYIKLYNYGERVLTNKMRAYLPQRIVQFLTSTHPTAHKIYLCRHGQSEYNVTGRLGGNSAITAKGVAFSEILGRFALEKICGMRRAADGNNASSSSSSSSSSEWVETRDTVRARLWTSSLLRTIQTAANIAHPVIHDGDWEQMSPRVYRNIDEIFAGDCEGMTPEEIVEKNPQAAYLRSMDKIGYRYPRGESYFDLISRLEPCIQEMESYTEPLLVVSHQAILRLIFAYLTGVAREQAPGMNTFSQNVVYEITLDASCEDLITEDVDAFPGFVIAHDFRDDVAELAAITDPALRKKFVDELDIDRFTPPKSPSPPNEKSYR